MDKRKLTILFTVFIDVLGIGIIIPILPFYVELFGAGPLVVTLLFAVFSFFSFFSAPILGSWSDKVGRRPILIISIFSTAVGWLVFAQASSILFLFIGRIIDGLAAGNFSIAQNYLADIAKDEKERTANLGLIGGVFGIAFIIGPVFGGLLSSISQNFPFWFVGVLALLNGVAAVLFLPETNTHKQSDKKIKLNPFEPIIRSISQKGVSLIFLAWFLFSLAIAAQQSIMALYVGDVFNFTVFNTGLMMAGIGVIIAINQAVLLKAIWLKYFSQENLTISTIFIMMTAFSVIWFPWLLVFLGALLLVTLAQSILRITLTNYLLKEGEVNRQGELLGVLTSVMSLAMIISPILAGLVYKKNPTYPFIGAAICLFLAFITILSKRKSDKRNALNINQTEIEQAERLMELS